MTLGTTEWVLIAILVLGITVPFYMMGRLLLVKSDHQTNDQS